MKDSIIMIATAITIGLATLSLIKSTIADLILPLIAMVFSYTKIQFFKQILGRSGFHYASFITEVITWLLIIYLATLFSKQAGKLEFFEEELGTMYCPPCPVCNSDADIPMDMDDTDVLNNMNTSIDNFTPQQEEDSSYANFYLN